MKTACLYMFENAGRFNYLLKSATNVRVFKQFSVNQQGKYDLVQRLIEFHVWRATDRSKFMFVGCSTWFLRAFSNAIGIVMDNMPFMFLIMLAKLFVS